MGLCSASMIFWFSTYWLDRNFCFCHVLWEVIFTNVWFTHIFESLSKNILPLFSYYIFLRPFLCKKKKRGDIMVCITFYFILIYLCFRCIFHDYALLRFCIFFPIFFYFVFSLNPTTFPSTSYSAFSLFLFS